MRIALCSCFVALVGCSNLTAPPVELAVAEGGTTTTTAASTAPAGQQQQQQPPSGRDQQPSAAQVAGDPETELKIEDLGPGTGPNVKMGDSVLVHYAGKLKNGTQFDASKSHQPPDPLEVTVGTGVIEGFSKGLVGMRVGGKRRVTIPWKMAYGEQGRPPVIPPKSTLIFELELVKIVKSGK